MLTTAYGVKQCDLLSVVLVQVILEGCPLVYSCERSVAPILGDIANRGSLPQLAVAQASGLYISHKVSRLSICQCLIPAICRSLGVITLPSPVVVVGTSGLLFTYAKLE